jgi:heme A synthase
VRDFISTLHLLTFVQILVTGSVATVWGIRAWRQGTFTDGFRSILYLTVGSGVAQAVLGGILFLSGCRPADNLHLVYALIVVAAIPIATAYASEKMEKRDMAILAFAAFAIVAAALRAASTGAGGYCPP